ncbi:hypothetical protein F66182_3142 [Fusarium sp. NRRL 66182]|nr:hypothetical protein F66182_3142 [Fusarium sp. NRRL 66182]
MPRIYAYGRSRLRRTDSTHQAFMILDYIDGQSLTKKLLRDSSEEQRHRLLGELVDIFAQLRELEFSQGGSLMPETTWADWVRSLFWREEVFTPQRNGDFDTQPIIAGAFSMRKNELQVDGCLLPRVKTNNANKFLREQHHLLRCIWEMPCQELEREEVERQEFALHFLNLEWVRNRFGIEVNPPAKDSFYLSHPDLRVNNIIVDDELHICGIIDWEFSATVPQHAFLPPLWLAGYEGLIGPKIDILSEFMSLLSSRRHLSIGHSRLARSWDLGDDVRLPMAYIFLEPSGLLQLFYDYIYPKVFNESPNKVTSDFFRHFQKRDLLERRLQASERYTQYLKDNNLLDSEAEMELQQHLEWVKNAEEQLKQLQGWSDKVQDDLKRLDAERAEQRHLQC